MEIEKYIEDINIAYKDDRIIVLNRINEIKNLASSPVKAEWFTVMLCTEGKASLTINNEIHTMKQNDLLLCHPETILEHCMLNLDFNFCGFCLSPEYMKQIFIISSNNWNARIFIENNPILSLNEYESQLFLQYYNLIRSKLKAPAHPHQKQLIDALLQAFKYEFHDSVEKHINIAPPQYNSADNLFTSFIELLENMYPRVNLVSYYAEKLCVTPKYLSTVCKKTCGETAHTIITHYINKDIEFLLKSPEKSIKEISNELNFSNLSFFGKYVKNNFGVSPTEFRKKLIEENEL